MSNTHSSERDPVVVTGIGLITPLGVTTRTTFDRLLAGHSGVQQLQGPEFAKLDVQIAAQVPDFDPASVVGARQVKRYGRFAVMALAAARQAVEDAKFREAAYPPERVAVLQGVGMGGLDVIDPGCVTFHFEGQSSVSPFAISGLIPNIAAGLVSIEFGLTGPSYSIAAACASSALALGESLRYLRSGALDAVIVGGAESALTPICIAAFSNCKTLSKRNEAPSAASRPFDRDRDGFVMGEGAAVLVLERLSAARKRGARCYAELAGYGATSDAHHVTLPPPDGAGAYNCIRLALADAHMEASEVDYVNAHATGTTAGDVTEAKVIHKLFGDRALVSSTKSMTGHLLGAAGALEAAVCALALHEQAVPATTNLERQDPQCTLNHVLRSTTDIPLRAAVSNSFGFGGHNAALVFRRVAA